MRTNTYRRFCQTAFLIAAAGLVSAASGAEPKQLLVVSVTKGFRHDVIPTVNELMGKLARDSGKFTVDYAGDDQEFAAKMTPAALRKYDAVVFNNTSGDLPVPDLDGFLAWVKSGKGFVGFHAATDSLKNIPAYVEMIGAAFRVHHEQVEVEALQQDPKHPATRPRGASFKVLD